MTFFIANLEDVKGVGQLPEFRDAMKDLEAAVQKRANDLWNGALPGGLFPTGEQYGMQPLRPPDMANDVADSTPSGSQSFRKNLAATTSSTTWRNLFNYTVRKDQVHGFAGLAVTDDVLRINSLQFVIGQHTFPIINIEEAQRYRRFAIVWKADKGRSLVADPNTAVTLGAYVESAGFQRVVPFGISVYRRPDLVITRT